MPAEKSLKNISLLVFDKIPDILFFFISIFFVTRFSETPLFPGYEPINDNHLLAVFALVFFSRKTSATLNLLILTISLGVHSYCAQTVGTFLPLFQFSWLVLGGFLVVRPEFSLAAITYNLGLTFDAAFMRTTGLGMQNSFYCASLVILLLAGVLAQLWQQGLENRCDWRHKLAFVCALFFISLTFFRRQNAYTHELMMLMATLTVFWSIAPSRQRNSLILAISMSGAMIALISLGNLAIISETFAEIFRRRAWAAGAHPNRIATWAFACQLLLQLLTAPQKNELFWRRGLRIFHFFLWTVIILSGARLILALSILTHCLYFGRRLLYDFRALLSGGIILALATARILQHFNWTELLKNERLLIWYSALANIGKRPFTGHGFWPMSFLPQSFPEASMLWAYDWNYPHSHQLFLELLLWGGIPLLLAAAAIFLISFRVNQNPAVRLCLAGFLVTGLFDFAWGSPAMLALAIFPLFFNFSTPEQAPQKIPVTGKILLLVLVAFSLIGALNLQLNIYSYEKASANIFRQQTGALEKASLSAQALKEPFPRMHLLIKKAAAGYKIPELIPEASALTLSYPDYYAAWFLLGRLLELDRNIKGAVACYEKAVKLEPRDLTGIRHARLVLTRLKQSSFQADFVDPLLIKIIKLGHWGLPLLVNHPDFGENLRQRAKEVGNQLLRLKQQPAIDLLFLFKNSTEWGIDLDFSLAQKLRNEKFPAWLEDELDASLLKRRFSQHNKLLRNDLEPLLNEKTGPALARAIAKLAVRAGLFDLAIKAYHRHRQVFNYRGKNYEDLEMQFYAAQAYLAEKKFALSKNELDRIAAFDQGNPAVFQLLGEIQENLGNLSYALSLYEKAKIYSINASFLPNFHFGIYDDNWPEGDHWTLVIEKTLRHRDNESRRYLLADWLKQVRFLDQKIEALKKMQPKK